MSDSPLEAAIKTINDSLKQLRQEGTDLSRQNITLRAVISALEKQKLQLQNDNSILSKDNELLTDKQTELGVELSNIVANKSNVETAIRQSETILESLNANIYSREQSIDVEVESYRAERMESLDDVNGQIFDSNEELQRLESTILELRTSIPEIQSQIDSKRDELANLQQEMVRQSADVKSAMLDLESERDSLKQQIRKLYDEQSEIRNTITDFQIERKEFLQYENSVRKALKAKDKSLQDQEYEINQKKILMGNRGSLLQSS